MNRWEAFSDDGVFDMKQRLKQMDTDKVQKKIESMIYAINKRNKSFDMTINGSLRLDSLEIKAGPKQEKVCPKCHKNDKVGDASTHFFICYRCNKTFIKPNQPKCSKHGSMKPCTWCIREHNKVGDAMEARIKK